MGQEEQKFFTSESERDLHSRFAAMIKDHAQLLDMLVGYFRTSGFYPLYLALEGVERIRKGCRIPTAV